MPMRNVHVINDLCALEEDLVRDADDHCCGGSELEGPPGMWSIASLADAFSEKMLRRATVWRPKRDRAYMERKVSGLLDYYSDLQSIS
jgi:hypothetical protein